MGVGGGKREEGGAAGVEIVEERSEQDVGSKQKNIHLPKCRSMVILIFS